MARPSAERSEGQTKNPRAPASTASRSTRTDSSVATARKALPFSRPIDPTTAGDPTTASGRSRSITAPSACESRRCAGMNRLTPSPACSPMRCGTSARPDDNCANASRMAPMHSRIGRQRCKSERVNKSTYPLSL